MLRHHQSKMIPCLARVIAAAKIILFGSLVLSGCSRNESKSIPSQETKSHNSSDSISDIREQVLESGQQATSARPSLFAVKGMPDRPVDQQLEVELDRVDAGTDGWDTEVFSQDTDSQWHRLGEVLIAQQVIDRSMISEFLGDQFVLDGVQNGDMTEVFRDDQVSVRRARARDNPATEPREVNAFVAYLTQMLAPSQHRKHAGFHTKTVEVDTDETPFATRVVVQATSHDNQQRRQHNAVWRCTWGTENQRPRLTSVKVVEIEEINSTTPEPLFADCTSSAFQGVDCYPRQLAYPLDHWRDRMDWRFGWEVIGAHGLAVADINGDGLEDLYICETGGLPNRLLLQQADGSLRDFSDESALNYLEPTHSALFLDLDNDGDQDAVFAAGTYVLIFENDGRARFTHRFVTNSKSIVRSLTSADYDRDGDLDLYVCGYSSREAVSESVGLGRPIPYHDANNSVPNYLLDNRGNWQFQDVTEAVGLDANNRRFSYAASWEDYDRDGDPDLYVANDFGRNNLYRNDDGQFTDVAADAGVEDISAGMSVSWGDYNRDGWPDLYVGNMFSSAGQRITYQRSFKEEADANERDLYQRHARGNSLFQNAGDGTFRDVSLEANVTRARWAWSSNFVDINNDGWKDLVVANGMVTSATDSGDL